MTAQIAPTLMRRRASARHSSMFLRMLFRAATLRRGRAAAAFLAMVVAAAVTTAMLNLYVDVQSKLSQEFRKYGANVVVVAKAGRALPANSLSVVESTIGARGVAAPFAYVVARTGDGQSVVVAGTDFARVRSLDGWWSVTAWPQKSGDTLVGVRAGSVVSPQNEPFQLTFHGRTIRLNPAGTLRTGASEDSRVYIGLDDFKTWTSVTPSLIEIAATGKPPEIDATLRQLAQALPDADIRPLRQIVEAEANVLGKTRSTLFVAALLIILTAASCVLATLIGWVFDRRADFAIMKALGASERLIASFFAAEAAALGTAGALAGFVLGIGVAAWIGQVNFHAAVVPRFRLLPLVLAGSIAVALMAAIVPISLLRRIQPALILRGE